MLIPSNSDVDTIYAAGLEMLLAFDCITIGEKRQMVIPSVSDVGFFYSVVPDVQRWQFCKVVKGTTSVGEVYRQN